MIQYPQGIKEKTKKLKQISSNNKLKSIFNTFENIFKFIYFYLFLLRWVSIAVWGFPPVPVRGCYPVVAFRLLITVVSLIFTHRLQAQGLSSCSSWALEHWLSMWCMGLVAQKHVASSWTRDWTRVPCIGRWILNHCTTREVLSYT